jgi:hypothetical protein
VPLPAYTRRLTARLARDGPLAEPHATADKAFTPDQPLALATRCRCEHPAAHGDSCLLCGRLAREG